MKGYPQDFDQIGIDESWTFDIKRSETSYASSNYHRYPAKFIPHIPRRIIENYSKPGDNVLDPFMGSGTTLLEAILLDRQGYGVDINPLSKLITTTKLHPIEPKFLERSIKEIMKQIKGEIKDHNLNPNKSTDDASEERIEYWFPDGTIRRELRIIYQYITSIDTQILKNFLLCGFSQILKNSSIWLMKSIKPTRSKTKQPKQPIWYFERHLKKMMRGNVELYHHMEDRIRLTIHERYQIFTASSIELPLDNNTINLIVTSPPYVTSYEYSDLHQLSTLWLEYAHDYRDLRHTFIGSMFRGKQDFNEIKHELQNNIGSPLAIKTIESFHQFPREQIPIAVYFYDMQKSLEECERVLKANGIMSIVIGNTSIKGLQIRNAEIFVEILRNLKFTIEKIVKRRIPSKILPQTRDKKTGRFTSSSKSDRLAYPYEFIIIARK